AEREEEARGVVVGPPPEHPRPDPEDQQLLEEPDERPGVGPARRILHLRAARSYRAAHMIAPADLARMPELIPEAAHRAHVTRITDIDIPTDGLVPDRQQLVPFLGTGTLPRIVLGDFLLNLGTKHTTNTDGPHRCDVDEDPR